MKSQVHFSLHDVAPLHQRRIEKALGLLEQWGVRRLTGLWVPDFHGKGESVADQSFTAFLQEPRALELEWVLHGYLHLDAGTLQQNSLGDYLRRKHMTGGEGEFLSLSAQEQDARLRMGAIAFQRTFGTPPHGFVAPAWLYRPELLDLLAAQGFSWTENHGGFEFLAPRRQVKAPVITWATRKLWLKAGSLAVCPTLYQLNASKPLIRIAVHPHDFDHPATVRSIESLVRKAVREREQVLVREIV